jgi:beta-lactamase superfamily II metal-dependent hydrolase
MKRLISAIFAVIFATALLTSCTSDKKKLQVMSVDVLDIGKADAIVIRLPQHVIMIDTGENENKKDVESFMQQNNIDTIDDLIITHFDDDHVGGADKILQNHTVKRVIMPDYPKDSTQYNEFIEALGKSSAESKILDNNMSFSYGNAKINIFVPDYSNVKSNDDNDMSLVTSLVYGDTSFLFAGDIQKSGIDNYLKHNSGHFDFLKVPHHGFYEKNIDELLSSVTPEFAAVTCSDKYPADEKLIKQLKAHNVKTFFTVDGTVHAQSDGRSVSVK